MCNYCGCREFPLIGRLTAEHEAIANSAGLLRAAITNEEHGLFPAAVIALPIPAWDRLTPQQPTPA